MKFFALSLVFALLAAPVLAANCHDYRRDWEDNHCQWCLDSGFPGGYKNYCTNLRRKMREVSRGSGLFYSVTIADTDFLSKLGVSNSISRS